MTDLHVMYRELCESRRGDYGVDRKTIERVLRRAAQADTARLSKRPRAGVVRQQPIDRQRKAEALKLVEEHGSAEASRRTGVSADTIR
jgi:hypothetical protein